MKKNKMTKEEIIQKYGNVPLRFRSYYKYQFTYMGQAENGEIVSAVVGDGSSEDIYSLELHSSVGENLVSLDANGIRVSLDGETIAVWDNF